RRQAPYPSHTSTLSLHDALPILQQGLMSASIQKHLQRLCAPQRQLRRRLLPTEDTPPAMIRRLGAFLGNGLFQIGAGIELTLWRDRKSTRLNSSHVSISYAVFCF